MVGGGGLADGAAAEGYLVVGGQHACPDGAIANDQLQEVHAGFVAQQLGVVVAKLFLHGVDDVVVELA